MSAKELEALFRCYVAKQVGTHGLLINSESFLSLQATACTTAHVYVSLLPSDMEYAILDPDSVRKCKFTVKENTSHLVCPSFNKELPTSDICNVHFGLVYICMYIYVNIKIVTTSYSIKWYRKTVFRKLSVKQNHHRTHKSCYSYLCK
jgi:hypothetical protein